VIERSTERPYMLDDFIRMLQRALRRGALNRIRIVKPTFQTQHREAHEFGAAAYARTSAIGKSRNSRDRIAGYGLRTAARGVRFESILM
jgi:hypothetical protein